MILVLLGTNPYPFTRLLNAVIEWAECEGETLVIQSGNTPVQTSKAIVKPFVDHDQIVEWISQADVVVSQGGFGSLQDCMAQNANIVAVPRLASLNESVDDQVELVKALEEEGLLIPVYDISMLGAAIDKARNGLVRRSTKGDIQESIAAEIDRYVSG